MPESFDAYHKWLGIPPEEQPPNHYRLLGLRPLEADGDVIANAADQRMSHVRNFQAGKHGPLSQRILNEIATAKLCLLNPAKKHEYDLGLQRLIDAAVEQQFSPGMMPPPQAPLTGPAPPIMASPAVAPLAAIPIVAVASPAYAPPVGPIEQALPTAVAAAILSDPAEPLRRRTNIRARRKQPAWQLPAAIGVAVLVAIVAGVLIKMNLPPAKHTAPNQTAERTKKKPKDRAESGPAGLVETSPNLDPKPVVAPVEPLKDEPQASLFEQLRSAVAAGRVTETESLGARGGTPFRELPRSGALLTGLNLTAAANGDVTSIQGVFLTATGTKAAKLHGAPGEKIAELRARAGYAIGGLQVRFGEKVNGIAALFMRIGKNRLVPSDNYTSPWVGASESNDTVTLDGAGSPVIGLVGSTQDELVRIGLLLEGKTDESSQPPSIPVQPFNAEKKRVPVPTAEAQQAARTLIFELYKKDFAEARTAEQRFALAVKLFHKAEETTDDPAGCYVLFDEARALAAQVGNSKAVIDVVVAMAMRYTIDDVAATLAAMTDTEKASAPAPFKRMQAESELALIDKAVARERFDAADRLDELARRAAAKANDSLLVRRVKWRSAKLREQRALHAEAEQALDVLKSHPDDPVANLAVGRYRSFVQDDWSAGLPLLAKGSSAAMVALAQQELANPSDPAEQQRLGSAWWSLAKGDEALKSVYTRRARHWTERAARGLSGLAKEKAERELQEMFLGHGLQGKYYAGQNFEREAKSRIDPTIDFNWGEGPPAPDVPADNFSIRWTGWVTPPAAGQYVFYLDHDDGARLWIDGKQRFDKSKSGQEQIQIHLSSGPHSIKVEFIEAEGVASITLQWAQKDGFSRQTVPAEALFHEQAAAQKGFSPLP